MRPHQVALTFALFLSLALTSCGQAGTNDTHTAAPEVTQEVLPTETPTPAPTPTTDTGLVIFIHDPVDSENNVAELSDLLSELAEQEGMRFEARQSLSPDEIITENISLAVLTSFDQEQASNLVSAAPQTQFLWIGAYDLEIPQNLTILDPLSNRPDMQGFLAGYIAAVVTTDWRVAVVSEAGTISGKSARSGFTNGVHFFCGLCRPVYPPFPVPTYPLYVELSPGAGPAQWDETIAYFKNWDVRSVYLAAPVNEESLLIHMSDAGFALISDRPPPPALQERWVASIGSADIAETIRDLWSKLISGNAAGRIDLALAFTYPNETHFSLGRQQYVNEMIADLLQGYIDVGVDPATGEMR